jgi:hypothetical protein
MAVDFPVGLIDGVLKAAGPGLSPAVAPTRFAARATGPVAIAPSRSVTASRVEPPQAPPTQTSPARQFEAMVIAQMIGSIMPQDSSYFGDGFAGDMWRSMLSENLAKVVAERSDFGIAAMVEKSSPAFATPLAAST